MVMHQGHEKIINEVNGNNRRKKAHTKVANSGLNSVTAFEEKLDYPGSNVTGSTGNTHYLSSAAAHSGLCSSAVWRVLGCSMFTRSQTEVFIRTKVLLRRAHGSIEKHKQIDMRKTRPWPIKLKI